MAGSVTLKPVGDQKISEQFALYNADCVEIARSIGDSRIDYSIFSPPFESLYTFSDDPRDFSNCASSETFWRQFRFLIA